MTKSKKYSIIAAICFAIYAIYLAKNFITMIKIMSDWFSAYPSLLLTYLPSIILDAIPTLACFGLALGLYLKNKIIIIVASSIYALRKIYWVFQSFSFSNVLSFLVLVAILITVVLSLKDNKIVQKIWFIGGTLCLINSFVDWVSYGYFSDFLSHCKYMVLDCIFIAGFIFVGLWLKEGDTFVEHKQVKKNIPNSTEPLNKDSSNSDTVEKLKLCKELLDSGTITQEEFDAKKKELLGL